MGITTQFFAVRWLTTLFAREFPFPTMLRIWDCLLADPQRFMLVQCLATAMLQMKEKDLGEKDFAESMQALQEYATPDCGVLLERMNEVRVNELKRRSGYRSLSELSGGGRRSEE